MYSKVSIVLGLAVASVIATSVSAQSFKISIGVRETV